MRLLLVVLAVTLADLGIRFLSGWPFPRVLVAEGVLFLAAAAVGLALERTVRDASARGRWLRRGLVAAFGLAGLRSLTWGLGAPVMAANLVTLAAGLALFVVWWRARRRSAP